MSKQIDSQGALKFLDFQFLKVLGSVRLSLRLYKSSCDLRDLGFLWTP